MAMLCISGARGQGQSDQDHAEMNLRVISADGAVLIDVDAKSERSK